MNAYLQKAAEWFITEKAPELRASVEQGIQAIDSAIALGDNAKKLFGLLLFSYTMRQKPDVFIEAQLAAESIGVLQEMMDYAIDWLGYSEKLKKDA